MNEQPGGRLLNLKNSFHAPRERMFSILSEPVELALWWGSRGLITPDDWETVGS